MQWRGVIRETKTGPVLQVPPDPPATELSLHTPWVIFGNKSKVFQANKTWKRGKGKI